MKDSFLNTYVHESSEETSIESLINHNYYSPSMNWFNAEYIVTRNRQEILQKNVIV